MFSDLNPKQADLLHKVLPTLYDWARVSARKEVARHNLDLDPEEVASSVVLRLCTHSTAWDPWEPARARGYLKVVARHYCYDESQRLARRELPVEPWKIVEEFPAASLANERGTVDIELFCQDIGLAKRETMIVKMVSEGYKTTDIGTALEISPAAAASAKHRVLQKARRAISGASDDWAF